MFQVSATPFLQDCSAPKALPLAPRDPNACPRFSIQMAAARKAGNGNSLYSYKRARNPLYQRGSNEEQDYRRHIFLNKVKKVGEEKKWESRSEQIMRQEFLARQKQWEMGQARTAPEAPSSPEEEEQVEESTRVHDVEMVDQILFQEDQSIEELVSSMQNAENDRDEIDHNHATSDYGNDEEEYDRLFMEVWSKEEDGDYRRAAQTVSGRHEDHEMDVSLG